MHFRDAARGLGLRGVFRRGVRRRGDAVPARLRSTDAVVRPALDPCYVGGGIERIKGDGSQETS